MALIYIYDNNSNKYFPNISDDIVIFSPSFYWFKICEIPTKNFAKARNIATHMMSDGPNNFLQIFLQKKGDSYAVYTYDEINIKNILTDLNIKEAKIYFADQLEVIDTVSIDEENYLFKFNNKVIELGDKDKKTTTSLINSYLSLLENKEPIVNLQKGDKKNSIFFTASTVALFIYLILFGFDKVSTLSTISKNTSNLNMQGKSYYEIKSLIKKYEKLENNSNKMKDDLHKVLKQNQIKKIEFKNNKLKVSK